MPTGLVHSIEELIPIEKALAQRLIAESTHFSFSSTSLREDSDLLSKVHPGHFHQLCFGAFHQVNPRVRAQMIALILLSRCRFQGTDQQTQSLLDSLTMALVHNLPTPRNQYYFYGLSKFARQPVESSQPLVKALCDYATQEMCFDDKTYPTICYLIETYLSNLLEPVIAKLVKKGYSKTEASAWILKQQSDNQTNALLPVDQLDQSLRPRSRDASPTRK